MDNPFILRQGNMIIGKNNAFIAETDCYALYELFTHHGEFSNHDEQQGRLVWLDTTLASLMRSGSLFLSPFPVDPRERLEEEERYLPEDMPWDLKVLYVNSVDKMHEHLMKNPQEYRVILVMNVKERSGNPFYDLFQLAVEAIRDPYRRLEWKLGGRPFTLPTSQWQRFKKDEQHLYRLLSDGLGARRLNYREVDYMLERFATPGAEPRKRNGDGSFYEVGPKDASVMMANPAEAVPVFEDTVLNPQVPGEIEFQKVLPDGIRKGYFSNLVINRLPRGYSQFPDTTALFQIIRQKFTFPAELSVQFVPLSWSYLRYSLRTVNYVGRMRNRGKENRGGEVDQKNRSTEDDSRDLANLLQGQETPMFYTQISIRVWGETQEKLYENRTRLQEALNQAGYEILIPSRQLPLFYNTLPGNPRKTGHQYIVKMTSEWLSALGPLNGVVIGDKRGIYVGDVIPFSERYEQERGVPVLFDIRRGSRDARISFSPAIIHYGSPGSGKSALANWILLMDVLRGSKALLFDPKNERWAWMFEIPGMRDWINLVTLQEEEDKGKLDPLLRINGTKQDRVAVNTAKKILWFLSENPESATYAEKAIGYAVDYVVDEYRQANYQGRKPCMRRVLEILRRYLEGDQAVQFKFPQKDFVREQAEREVARALTELEYNTESSLARLLFAEGHETPIDVSKPITLLQVQGLIKSDKEEDPDLKYNTAVIMGICDLADWFVAQEAAGRMVVFEELHEFGEKETIRRMVRQLLRKGRSMNNVVQLIIHNMRDLDLDRNLDEDGASEVRSNLGTRFVYRVTDKGEARKACGMLGIDPTEDLVDFMSSGTQMKSGEFLMRDADGHVGFVRFPLDEVDPTLYQAFRTDTDAQKERQRKYGHLLYQKHNLKVVGK
ncbi:hypothetical protein GXN76_02035 [Kroppenstedtia pulmonis]|uniref:ATP-binding protein n=1 Tax=Kroppenstedtia pulmonis TaxID=1380685 RepID=A0A7D3XNX0_9BACL|nr:ATP-binding protein [Kroppenstedtia pulmonis]QKG83367.1 hypothetical protein GXN76_02035 [Kroppenstedtia pulmonis]